MKTIGELVCYNRKKQKLSQEELAEKAKVSLRTIQRIENNENIPRGFTLKSILAALKISDIDLEESFLENKITSRFEIIIAYFFLLILNLFQIAIIGYLVLDTEANLNSKLGGLFISFLLPVFIVFLSQKMSKTERILKFGMGYFFYFIFSIVVIGFPMVFTSGLLICLVIAIITLYFGEILIKIKN